MPEGYRESGITSGCNDGIGQVRSENGFVHEGQDNFLLSQECPIFCSLGLPFSHVGQSCRFCSGIFARGQSRWGSCLLRQMIEAQDGVFFDGRCCSLAEEKSWVSTVPLKSDCIDFGSLFSDAILVLEGRETADCLVNWDVADPQAHCDRFVSLWQWFSEFVCGLAFSFGRLLALQAFALAWAALLVHEFQVLQEILVFFARVRARQRIVPFPPVSLAQDFLKFGLMALCLNILILEAGFRDEADDLGVRCLIFLCRLQVGGLGLGFLLALNRSRRDEILKMPARSDTHRHVRRRQKARYFRAIAFLLLIGTGEATAIGQRSGLPSSAADDQESSHSSGLCGDESTTSSFLCQESQLGIPGPLSEGHVDVIQNRCHLLSGLDGHVVEPLSAPLRFDCSGFEPMCRANSLLIDGPRFACFPCDPYREHESGDSSDVSTIMQIRYARPADEWRTEPNLLQNYLHAVVGDSIEPTTLVWLHQAEYIGRYVSFSRALRVSQGVDLAWQVRHVWGDMLHRRTGFAFPVRPPPFDWGGRIVTLQPHLILTTVQGDMYFPLLVDFRDQFLRRGTFVFFGRTFPAALQLFQAVSPQTDCFWGAECYVYVGSYGQERELTWNMVVPLYEGAYVRMVVIERPQPMLRQAESTCTPASDSGSARSDASSHDLFVDEDLAETEEILVSRDQTSFLQHGVQEADKWDRSCLHSLEENTATSLYPALAIERRVLMKKMNSCGSCKVSLISGLSLTLVVQLSVVRHICRSSG